MHNSIVVPLDGSAFGKRALPLALALARRSDAAIHLVHVQEPLVHPGGAPMYDTRLHDDLQNAAQADVTGLAVALGRGTSRRISAEFLEGPVSLTLQEYLAANEHGLVVMTTHGRGGLSRALLGNVADGLVRHTHGPLLLVRPGTEWPSELVEPLFRHVLIPLDGSAMAEEIVDQAVLLATPGVTMYTLLTVVEPVSLLGHPYPQSEAAIDGSNIEAAQAHLDSVAMELRVSGARVETRVVLHERTAKSILAAADEVQADMIAISTHGLGGVARLVLGSVADKVLRGATVPVLVYRPAAARPETAGVRQL